MTIHIPPTTVTMHFDPDVEVTHFLDGRRSAVRVGYNADGLKVWNKNVDFLKDPDFVQAYRRGMDSGHKISRPAGSREDIHLEWRVMVCCWAGWQAKQLAGDYVECGVNTGIFSLAVCQYVDFNATGKRFWLFDTYSGIPEDQVTPVEHAGGRIEHSRASYEECYELAKRNFSPYPRSRLVRGTVPDSLATVPIDQVCYLSLDMNLVLPEIAAIRYFWDKLVPGAPVILDDYGWLGYEAQKVAMDEFAAGKGLKVLPLPTGQGLLIKP
jgi:hypothetical protein